MRALQLSTLIPLETRLRELFDSASPSRSEFSAWILSALEKRMIRHHT
jgi:hypothetical protein